MLKEIALILLVSSSFVATAQTESFIECATVIDASNIEYLEELNEKWITTAPYEKAYGTTTEFVPVQLHIIRQSAGSGGISSSDALRAFDRMNNFYIDASMHFYQCAPINYIDNSTYYDYDKTQMNDLDGAYSTSNVVNIYIANSATSGASSICGHAQFPGGLDFIMVTTSCMNNGTTLSHEMGHYMGLYHTHETSFGDESVDGSDCLVDGDLLCDTPADPRLNGSTNLDNAGCVYSSTDLDENGDLYSPSVTNAMSYTSKECRYTFTEDQYTRLLWTLENERTYLTCSTPDLLSAFYVNPENTCLPTREIAFYNASEGNPISYLWDFGDASASSTSESPTHIYNGNGVYTVSLTIDNGFTTDTYTMDVVVGAITIPYTNDFEAGIAALDKYEQHVRMKNEVQVSTEAAKDGSYGLLFDGIEVNSTSPNFQTPTSADVFDELWNPYFKSAITLCVDAGGYNALTLEFDKRQLRTTDDNYTNLRITVDGIAVSPVYQVETSSTDDPDFVHITLDLTPYAWTLFTLGIEGSHKYDKDRSGTNNGSATFIDNLSITGNVSPVGLNDLNLGSNLLSVSPNPTTGEITISGHPENLKELRIYDALGREVSEKVEYSPQSDSSIQVNLDQCASGIYIIKTRWSSTKIVKK
ncbi:MAG: PKD repeat protein [Crocinitomicaceae bacterium]|jgi:PKD repeat protein